MSKNNAYPPEFKAHVVALALSGEIPKRQVAEDVGSRRRRCFGGSSRPTSTPDAGRRATTDELAELAELRKRNDLPAGP